MIMCQRPVRCLSNLFVEVEDLRTGAVERQETHNLVTTAGLNLVRDRLNASAVAALGWLAIGTGTTAVSAADTELDTETLRGAFTSTTASAGKLTIKYYLDGATGNSTTLAECGLFNAASTGTMYARALLASTIAKTSSKAVTFTWEISWT